MRASIDERECTLFLQLNEEQYASDSGAAYTAAESHAAQTGRYPVTYPEPYGSLGCGYGPLTAYVKRECCALAHEFRLDLRLCDQTELIITVSGASREVYERFVTLLGPRLKTVRAWIVNPPKEWSGV